MVLIIGNTNDFWAIVFQAYLNMFKVIWPVISFTIFPAVYKEFWNISIWDINLTCAGNISTGRNAPGRNVNECVTQLAKKTKSK